MSDQIAGPDQAMTSEVAPLAYAAAELAEAPKRGETWRILRRRPAFLISSAIIAFMLLIAAFPAPVAGLFGNGDPRYCDLASSGVGPQSGHPFGFDIQGCDLYANVIYG